MHDYRLNALLSAAFILVALSTTCGFPPTKLIAQEPSTKTAEGVVRHLYDLVTFKGGNPPDWSYVKTLFIDEAVIVLRTGREKTTVFSLNGWVQDFVDFIAKAEIADVGFTERIIRLKPVVMGDMAQILVLYESSTPGSPRAPRPGVDSFLLIKKEERWRIVAITNEIPSEDRPIPEELRN